MTRNSLILKSKRDSFKSEKVNTPTVPMTIQRKLNIELKAVKINWKFPYLQPTVSKVSSKN